MKPNLENSLVIHPFVKFEDGVIKLRDVHGEMFTWLQDDQALQLLSELSEAVHRRYNDKAETEPAKDNGDRLLASATLLDRFHYAQAHLLKWRSMEFPVGSVVTVDCEKYKGSGKVVPSSLCPPDQLAVLLENNNIWWYPLEACSKRSNDRTQRRRATDQPNATAAAPRRRSPATC